MKKHRRVTQRGLEFIKRWEGFSPVPYYCSAGVRTIGWGHVIKPTETLLRVSEQEAEALLVQDLFVAERAVLRLIRVPLTDNQFDSLTSFTFNVGSGALQRSTLRARLNRGDYDVREQFLRWIRAGGKVIRGLLRRRIAEANMFEGG
ncbi:MAG: Lysozyme RrrD [candidate division WS2 bacterium]|nr:Lysozyme RrrD [Candidatus Lithacetigena glycinireducens]